MKLSRRITALSALLVSLQMVSAGDIVGKITLKGTPPPEADIPLDKDLFCGPLNQGKPNPKTRFYAVEKNGELADVFVYVKDGLTGKTFPVPEKAGLLDQVNCQYVPYVIGLQTNQKLRIRTSDSMMHNVHIMPINPPNKEFNRAMLPKQKDLEYSFPTEEIFVKFKCDVHQWMFAYVGVVNHPFYSVSDKDGTFKISNLPAGDYTIEAYHRKAGKKTQKVTVEAEGKKEANFTLEVPPPK